MSRGAYTTIAQQVFALNIKHYTCFFRPIKSIITIKCQTNWLIYPHFIFSSYILLVALASLIPTFTESRFGFGSHSRGGWIPFLGFRRAKVAKVTLISGGDSGVSGQLLLSQSHPNGPVVVKGLIKGLQKGPHGFHVHMKGELGNNCKDAGSHFNPFMASLNLLFS